MEIQCTNKCGNLTVENSEFCEICAGISKEICMKCDHEPDGINRFFCDCVCHITGEVI